MEIGKKIKNLRIQQGLTQEELAGRCELSKGFISQLENDLTSPSISTLMDILLVLGTSIPEFFNDDLSLQIIFTEKDVFTQILEDNSQISWLIPNAQKNAMEPMLVNLKPNGSIRKMEPHFADIFIYVLYGEIVLINGDVENKVMENQSIYLSKPRKMHTIINKSNDYAKIIWVSTPPIY